MIKLNNEDIIDLIRIYNIPSESGNTKAMRKYIRKILFESKIKCKKDKAGNVYATKGEADSYPCIACHTDEVHTNRGKYNAVASKFNGVIYGWSHTHRDFCGIGGDDKNGIFIALYMLKHLDYCKAVFFADEEIGCVGSSKADISFFSDCRYIIECDRRGNSDLITNISGQICSDEFINAIKPYTDAYSYQETSGLMTDVDELHDKGVGISCINLSCGYHRPHTQFEYTIIEDLEVCMNLVYTICSNVTQTYPHTKSYTYKYHYDRFDNWYNYLQDKDISKDIAKSIKGFIMGTEIDEVSYDDLIVLVEQELLAQGVIDYRNTDDYYLFNDTFDMVYEEMLIDKINNHES